MQVDIIPIDASIKRSDGIEKVVLDTLPLPKDFANQFQVMIYLPPKGIGGNHKHARKELFLTLSDDVELHWEDSNGNRFCHKMRDEKHLFLFVVHPFTPHAIVNKSEFPAILLELTDALQSNVEPYPLISL